MAIRVISVQLAASMGNFASTFKEASGYPRQLGTELETLGTKSKQQFSTITDAAGKLGLGLVGAFVGVAASAAAFDKQMSEVAAVSGASGKSLDSLRQAAINAGQATVYSAEEAANAEAELAKAGVSTADILGGALTGSMSLASAGSLSLADAATDTAQALNIFGLGGSSASHVADLLSAGANKSATDVAHLADSLNQSGLVAKQTGLSIEDTVGALALFAQNGLVGSDAGTSFKVMLQALQAPSSKTKGLMDQLGISAYDAGGKFIGITAFAQQLQNQLKGLTQEQRDYALAQIFGNDAVRAADVLYKSGAAGLQQWITGVNQTGAASDTAKQKMNNLAGDIENLKGSFETLTISSGEGVQSGLRSFTQAATRAVNSIGVMPATASKWGVAISGLVGGGLLLSTVLAKAQQKSNDLQASLKAMGPAGAKAAGALSGLTSIGSRLTVILSGLQIVSAAFGTSINSPVSETVKNLDALGASGKAAGADLSHLDYDLGTLGSGGLTKFGNGAAGFVESITGMGNVMDESLTHAKERIADIDTGLAAMVSAGNIQQANAAFQQLWDIAQKQGISLSDLKAGLPDFVAAMDNYNDTQKKGAAATGANASATDDLANAQAGASASATSLAIQQQGVVNSIEDTIGNVKGLINLFDSLNGNNISVVKSEDDLEAAYDATTAAIKANGKTAIDNHKVLDDTTAKGRANREALLGIASAAEDASQATLNQTGSSEKAAAVLAKARGVFIDDAIAMGLSKDAAKKLADTLFKLPPTTSAAVTTPGLANSYQMMNDFAKTYQGLGKPPASAPVSAPGLVNTYKELDGFAKTYQGLGKPAAKAPVSAPGLTNTYKELDGFATAYQNIGKPPATAPVSAPGLTSTYKELDGFATSFAALNGRVANAYVNVHINQGQLNKVLNELSRVPGAGNRWGGVYTHNERGGIYEHAEIGLSSAGIYSSQAPARYAFAEPSTGGEGFVPKNGNYARSTSIIDTEARWYGGRFVPNGGATAAAPSMSTSSSVTYAVYPQRSNMTVQDLAALSARHDAQMRVGRRQ